MSSYYAPAEEVIQHYQAHHQRNPVTKKFFCKICYKKPSRRHIPSEFDRFWTWIHTDHHATEYNGYTISSFKELQNRIDPWDYSLFGEKATYLLESIKFLEPLTPLTELCFYFHSLFVATTGFSTRIQPFAIANAYLRYRQHLQQEQETQLEEIKVTEPTQLEQPPVPTNISNSPVRSQSPSQNNTPINSPPSSPVLQPVQPVNMAATESTLGIIIYLGKKQLICLKALNL